MVLFQDLLYFQNQMNTQSSIMGNPRVLFTSLSVCEVWTKLRTHVHAGCSLQISPSIRSGPSFLVVANVSKCLFPLLEWTLTAVGGKVPRIHVFMIAHIRIVSVECPSVSTLVYPWPISESWWRLSLCKKGWPLESTIILRRKFEFACYE